MTDWNAFIDAAEKVVLNYSDYDFRDCLIALEPRLLEEFTAADRLLIRIGVTSSKWGRARCFRGIFYSIKHKYPDLFLAMPGEALEAYNRLLGALFSEKVAKEFVMQPRARVMKKPEVAEVVAPLAPPVVVVEKEPEGFRHEEEQARIKAAAAPYFQKVVTQELMVFSDLPIEIKRIVSQKYEGEATGKEEIKAFYDGLITQLDQVVQAANSRAAKLDEMAEYVKVFTILTKPASRFKDLADDFRALKERVAHFSLQKQEFAKGTFSENEARLQECYASYSELKKSMPGLIQQLVAKANASERTAEDTKAAIKRRLFEIFWNLSPYLDLTENFQDMRKELSSQLQEGMRKYYSGECSSQDLLALCQEMPYEHDVVKLRNEVTHRSARLKDLRDELIRLLYDVSDVKRLLEVSSVPHDKVYLEITAQQEVIKKILEEVENPFQAFQKAETKDDINYIFRNFWIRIENVQPKVEEALRLALETLEGHTAMLKSAFLTALDTLEELFTLQSGTRAQLVAKAETKLQYCPEEQLYQTLISQIHSIEKRHSFCKPFSFFMAVTEHKKRLEMLKEAQAVDARIKATIDFAKQMQYVKTFEEERVDIILEAFERQHLIVESDWAKYRERMQLAARLVEDEIYLDIGLLDRHAVMDVDPKELNKTLRLACKHANDHIFEPKYGILARIEMIVPEKAFCKRAQEELVAGFTKWSQVVVDETKTTDWLLEHLRNFCHYLFDAKVAEAAYNNMLLPKCLQLINEVRSYVNLVEVQLQQKRTQHSAEWGPEWIVECHDMRKEIACFEPDKEAAQALEPLIKKVVTAADAQSEFEAHLQEIEALTNSPKRDYPFIYIPGYLAFFDVGASRLS